jgi:hypothetical protein
MESGQQVAAFSRFRGINIFFTRLGVVEYFKKRKEKDKETDDVSLDRISVTPDIKREGRSCSSHLVFSHVFFFFS